MKIPRECPICDDSLPVDPNEALEHALDHAKDLQRQVQVVRCGACHIVQFMTRSLRCRKCAAVLPFRKLFAARIRSDGPSK